jgi:DNA-binding transcriptional regulator YiaG
VRWLRARLGLGLSAFAYRLAASPGSVRAWERGGNPPARLMRARLGALLAPPLATPEGEAFMHALGRGEAAE